MPEPIRGIHCPNVEGAVVLGDVVSLQPSASWSSDRKTGYTIGLVLKFEHPSAVPADVADYLPRAHESSCLVLLRWFAEVPKAQRTYAEHASPNAARCPELVLVLEESWVPVEDVLGLVLVWHIDDVESGECPIEAMASAYVIAHEQTRKRKASGGKLGTFHLAPVDSAQWTALPEHKATATDRFGRTLVHTTLLGERWETVMMVRRLVHGRLSAAKGGSGSFTVKVPSFSGRQWEVLAGGIAAAGTRPTTVRQVDAGQWVEMGSGEAIRTTTTENVHEMAVDTSRADERRAVDAVLGRGWDWARAERLLKGASVGPSVPIKSDDTLKLARAVAKGTKRKATVVFRWRQGAAELAVRVDFQSGSAGQLNEVFSLFPGALA